MDFEALIPDYVNEALDPETLAAFEAELARNPALASAVATERAWAEAMRRDRTTTSVDYQTFQPRIQPRWTRRYGPLAAAAFALVLAVLIAAPSWRSSGEFQTLSDPTPPLSHDVLRIVVRQSQDVSSLVEEYKLRVVREYPAAFTVDIDARAVDVSQEAALREDHRTALIQRIDGDDS